MRSRFKVINNKSLSNNSHQNLNNKGDVELKNIRQRKDGRWEYRKTINHIKYDIIKPTQKELLKEIKNFKQKFTTTYENQKEKTLIEYLYYWAETYKKGRIKEKPYKEIIRKFRIYVESSKIANIKINKINSEVIQEFLNKIPRSRSKEILTIYLKAALTKAYKTQKIKYDIFENVEVDKKLNNIETPFNYDEQVKIINNLKHTDIEKVIMFYLLTGIRSNELPSTKEELLNSLDLNNNTLKIKCEKKREERNIYRYIDLSKQTMQFIYENAEEITKYKTSTIYHKFKKLLEEINVEGHLHKLRHTFTTNNFYLGNPDKIISSWLGHTKVDLTQQVYIYIDRSITKQKIEELYNNMYYKFDPTFDPTF